MSATSIRGRLAAHWWEASTVAAAAFAVAFIVALLLHAAGTNTGAYLDNLTETAAAYFAAAVCGLTAVKNHGRIRLAWMLIGASALSWGTGQAIWDWYEIVAKIQVPFPSPADAGYLGAVPLAIAGVLAFPVAFERARTHIRSILEGLIIAAALLVVSWDTVLGAVYRAGADSPLSMVLSLLYPLSDVAIVTMILVRLGRVAREDRVPLLFLAGGLAAAAVADSNFAYTTANGTYGSGNVLDAGWVAGYLLIAIAALRMVSRPVRGALPHVLPSRWTSLLPYPPIAAALAMAMAEKLTTGQLSEFTFWTVLALVGIVLVRQYLVVVDNVRLVRTLSAREKQLAHQAHHDALTSLPNRVYFRDCVIRALEHNTGTHTRFAVLFIDLDEFKAVNDTHGHGMGDRVLVVVADRLRASLRPADIAARLGGDEFAVLVDHAPDQKQLDAMARRILQALREPMTVEGVAMSVPGTIGMALAEGDTDTCDELLRRADVAMYAAKREGKDRVGVYRALAA
ncbi:MAG TPA: GGDEF domain-containing protein [Candidatus Acidoferrales bacterium]|jgi:diguanylate cyclase (GGDEF)-like protein|nr:GGDEF domain-containing protein [Candidatus Acidoferrales bacterium]